MAENIYEFLFPESRYRTLSAYDLVSKWEGREINEMTIGNFFNIRNMIEIERKNGFPVKVFAETFEQEAYEQVKALAEYDAYKDSCIRIMPDAHAGKGCTIGTTMTIHGKVTPNLVGVDVGCGMLVVELGKDLMPDFKKLDEVIRSFIPSGFSVHDERVGWFSPLKLLRCRDYVDIDRAERSIGTLGGGNHFIELNVDEGGCYYLVIHSGSRNLGVQVCNHYQERAVKKLTDKGALVAETIQRLKAEGREREINDAIRAIKKPDCNKDLAHLENTDFQDYFFDMRIVQTFASVNREKMAAIILEKMGWHSFNTFQTIHNYIDIDAMILRKGAVRALKGECLIIPMNMRDGSLICIGKGNPDWNYSAPHGAGRLMSRAKARASLSVDEFKREMEGVYSTTVGQVTIDESPMAYKPMEEIIRCIEPTVSVEKIIKPIYNFKAGE